MYLDFRILLYVIDTRNIAVQGRCRGLHVLSHLGLPLAFVMVDLVGVAVGDKLAFM
jgi:hypothetical protein